MKFGTAVIEGAPTGQNVIVRTVTHYYTGRVVELTDRWLVLEDCAWIADTGQWSAALASGTLSEVEPYPDGAVWVSVGAVVDIAAWGHALPRTVQ
jgi:hypothetical protein